MRGFCKTLFLEVIGMEMKCFTGHLDVPLLPWYVQVMHMHSSDINIQCVKMMLMFKLKNFMLKRNDIFMCCSIPEFLIFLDVIKCYT